MSEIFSEIGRLLLTQDNRATSHPIFMVQRYDRIWSDSDYAEKYMWMTHDYDGEADAETSAQLDTLERDKFHGFGPDDEDDATDDESVFLKDWRKVYYTETWLSVQPFFTERAAEAYITSNGHNLKKYGQRARIYVESGYRNEEWIALRAAFIARAEGRE